MSIPIKKSHDPEEVNYIQHVGRPLNCIFYMRWGIEFWWLRNSNVDHLDAGYCLDRYSLIDRDYGRAEA